MIKLKKYIFLSLIGAFTLVACSPGALNYIEFKHANPFKTSYNPNLNNINKNNALFDDQGLEAIDPSKCTNGDLCYFQYINDRSFSIFKSVKTKDNPSGGGWGTGWFVDREVGTNNFYITTNVHVANLADKTIIPYNKPNPDPELLNISIGRQRLDTNLLNKNVKALQNSSYFSVKNWTNANHTDPDKRILTQVNLPKREFNKNEQYKKRFSIGYKLNNPQYNFFLDVKDPGNNYDYLNYELIPYLSQIAKNYDISLKYKKTLFSANDVFEFGFHESVKNGTFFTSYFDDSSLKVGISEFNSFFNTNETKKEVYVDPINDINKTAYIDQATLKVTIPDQVLAAQFPYFLNPKKYNQWTFPKFSQKQLPDTKDKNEIQITDSNKLTTIYQAGYPVENLKGNLTYSSKGGPTFRMTKGKIINYFLNQGSRDLDNYTCKTTDINTCKPNKLPMSNNNIVLENDYSTGGGSSGSMVINDKYEVVGIYWGIYPNGANLPSKFNSNNLAHPLYWEDHSLNWTTFNSNNFTKNTKKAFDGLYSKMIIESYIKNKANDILDTYQKINNKTNKGLRFDNIENLKIDLLNFTDKNEITNQVEEGGDKTEEQKLDAIISALKSLYSGKDKLYMNQSNNMINILKNNLNVIFTPFLLVGNSETSYYGSINYKQQLTDLFKANNIKTYNLNPPAK